MVPYRGRLALRIARLVVAISCGSWYLRAAGFELSWITALLAAYAAYAVGLLFDISHDSRLRAAITIGADAAYFALWAWLSPGSWEPAVACAFLLVSTVLLHDLMRACIAGGVALFIAIVLPPQGPGALVWTVVALVGVAVAIGAYKRFLDERMSSTLRANVIIRSQAQGAREAERQRIAADFHDGPLQSFISFQMRLEIIRKLMSRDADAAAEELRQLQDLCRSQVTDLRSFVRSMRPQDEGMGLAASLSRMTDLFQRDTGIASSFTTGELPDPSETEVSLELLQIVREALNNVQKHSGATRVALTAGKRERMVEIVVEDNGGGFPFTGSFQLDELELLRLGPASIKRRVRMPEGEMSLESKPGQGSRMSIRVPA
jgi:signal transduction histidine kinase